MCALGAKTTRRRRHPNCLPRSAIFESWCRPTHVCAVLAKYNAFRCLSIAHTIPKCALNTHMAHPFTRAQRSAERERTNKRSIVRRSPPSLRCSRSLSTVLFLVCLCGVVRVKHAHRYDQSFRISVYMFVCANTRSCIVDCVCVFTLSIHSAGAATARQSEFVGPSSVERPPTLVIAPIPVRS